ncbi:MAG: glycosyltransferase family 2 protein, partial [Gammaproteobacteria bacterium]
MAQSPKIAVIILNFNSAIHTLRCVDSIYKHAAELLNVTLVVVDNHSEPVDKDRLTPLAAKNVTLIYSDKNLGFSGGMMLGARSIEAEYYFFLNNDCEFQNDVLVTLSHFMEADARVALCSGSMFDTNGQPRTSFNYFPSLALTLFGSGLLRLLHPNRYPNRRKQYTRPVPVDVVTGAAMFVRGTVLWKLGGLDTGYFLYCEEEDFALRIRKAGWRIYLVPQARIMHIGGASSSDSELRPALRREFYISFFRYLRLHHGSGYALIFRLLIAVKMLRRAITGKMKFN